MLTLMKHRKTPKDFVFFFRETKFIKKSMLG